MTTQEKARLFELRQLSILLEDHNLTFSNPISVYDIGIIYAVEILVRENTRVTPQSIYEVIHGIPYDVKSKRAQEYAKYIVDEIDKMMSTMLEIDWSEYYVQRKLGKEGDKHWTKEKLLWVAKWSVIGDDHEEIAYSYHCESPLYEYANALGYIFTIFGGQCNDNT